MVVVQLIGTSCSRYNNNCITKLWAPFFNFYICTWFYWNCTQFCHSKLIWKFQNYWLKTSTQSSQVIQSTFFLWLFCILSSSFIKPTSNRQSSLLFFIDKSYQKIWLQIRIALQLRLMILFYQRDHTLILLKTQIQEGIRFFNTLIQML